MQSDAGLPALAVCPRGRELTLRSAICAHRTMITAPRSRHPGRDWVLCRVHVGRSRHCSSWCPERGIGRWPGRRYGRGRGQRLPEPDSHAHDGARGRGPVVSRVGLPDVHHQRPRGGSARAQRGWYADPDLLDAGCCLRGWGWILLMRKKFERSEQALGAIPGAKFKPREATWGIGLPSVYRVRSASVCRATRYGRLCH